MHLSAYFTDFVHNPPDFTDLGKNPYEDHSKIYIQIRFKIWIETHIKIYIKIQIEIRTKIYIKINIEIDIKIKILIDIHIENCFQWELFLLFCVGNFAKAMATSNIMDIYLIHFLWIFQFPSSAQIFIVGDSILNVE